MTITHEAPALNDEATGEDPGLAAEQSPEERLFAFAVDVFNSLGEDYPWLSTAEMESLGRMIDPPPTLSEEALQKVRDHFVDRMAQVAIRNELDQLPAEYRDQLPERLQSVLGTFPKLTSNEWAKIWEEQAGKVLELADAWRTGDSLRTDDRGISSTAKIRAAQLRRKQAKSKEDLDARKAVVGATKAGPTLNGKKINKSKR